jgi:hypothetical protein
MPSCLKGSSLNSHDCGIFSDADTPRRSGVIILRVAVSWGRVAGKGASIFKMMDVSRHKSVDTLRGYVRDAELFKDHAGAGLL